MARERILTKLLLAAALTLAILLDTCRTDDKVSFYGASYIHLPVQEAKSATDIAFRFRTHLKDAMLLLAAGRTDYCLIRLESGRLKVNINLGAGEKELASDRELVLNDLGWHEVNITRRDANITLTIDRIHSVGAVLPGKFFELNINFGVYIGGQGLQVVKDLFFGHMEYMRGCMADISYNGLRVVEQARYRRNGAEATAVSWGCSAEFDARPSDDISFVDDGAFAAVPRPIPRSGARWELELKTSSADGLLLFNAGHASYADFLAIELYQGHVRLLMNKGNGPTELTHAYLVSDGHWHRLQFDFAPNLIGIGVDGRFQNLSIASGNRYLDLAETLYVGGTELSKRANALAKGVRNGDVSYKGCLRNMWLAGKELGLAHVKVSQGVVVNCVWGFPCAEAEPCVKDAMCSQLGVRSFKCTCDQSLCIKSNFTEEYKLNTNLPLSLEILSVQAINVAEGRRAALDERHISVVLDIAKYGLNESHVILALLTPPTHGSLQIDRINLPPKTPFTLHDVLQQKVSYVHDGSETLQDTMLLKLALQAAPAVAGTKVQLPNYFQDSLRFSLSVNVTPVNDPPRLDISPAAVLRLAQGTRKKLSRDLVWAHDADTSAETLVYAVLGNDSDIGHLERIDAEGVKVRTFTQADLEKGLIEYVHSGKNKSKAVLGLKVSDGETHSAPQYLRVSTYPLHIKLRHNTGLVVVHRSFAYISTANLSFATNAEDARVDIKFTVIRPPQYGQLQRQHEPNQPWLQTEQFSTRDLELRSVRYVQNLGSPLRDSFRFQAGVREMQPNLTYDFEISFIVLELLKVQRASVNFSDATDSLVDARNLEYQTNPLRTEPSLVVYSLLELPRFGHLYLDYERLRIGQTFNQRDVNSRRLRYRLFHRAYSPIHDALLFKVTAPQCADLFETLDFHYQPYQGGHLPEIQEQAQVQEGQRVALKMRTNFRDFGLSRLNFNLTQRPGHGFLSVYNGSVVTRFNTTYFAFDELAALRVYYEHDDSETTEDSFEFLAVSGGGGGGGGGSDEADFMYIGRFAVSVELRNDNKPERVDPRVFRVVTNSERIISKADLQYRDADINTEPKDIVYTVMQLSNGDLYRVDQPHRRISRFTQEDVNEDKICYKHRGNPIERMDFVVSDRELTTKGELEIQAGQAYAKLLLRDNVVVQSNQSVVLSVADLDLETNVHANATDVHFSLLEKPKYGVLLKLRREATSFDKDDLLHRYVSYRHLGQAQKKDHMRIKVQVRDGAAEDTGVLGIKIYPEIYWEPMSVHNGTVYVEEATSVILSRKSLEAGNVGIPANRVTYHVKEWPSNGYLEIQYPEEPSTGQQSSADLDEFGTHLVKHFEQSLVNDNRLYYVQSAPNQTHDRFVVDVTNSIGWIRDVVVNIVIVPDKLYVGARNLSVPEGKSVVLHEFDFYAVTAYYAGKFTDYRLTEKPRHGNLMDSKNNPIRKFEHKQLANGEIVYKHNGDEAPYECLKMTVTAGEKHSEPFELWLDVTPINDELPQVVNKTRLTVWRGGSVVLSNGALGAVDNDTAPTELVYNVKETVNGYFALAEAPGVEIHNFSQEMINTKKVIFTHTEKTEAEFKFSVNDGVHSTETYRVSIGTKPVSLSLERNQALNVFPLTRKPLSSELLLAKCTDPDRDVKYVVKTNPAMGKIIMETADGTWLEVDRFTQRDLNNSKVSYEHNKQFNNLSASDSFQFDIETHFAEPMRELEFRVDISVSSGGLHRYATVTPVHVDEGGSAPLAINVSGIVQFLRTKAAIPQPDVSVRLLRQPAHGHVMLLHGLNLTTYSQSEIEGHKIGYFHDHSDTSRDQIDFSVFVSPGHVTLCNVSIPVEIAPINDQPFELKVVEPLDVVQNQTQTITKSHLLTVDPDTAARDIVYEVISAPTYGRLLLVATDQAPNDEPQVLKFTQHDIDSSRLVYEHRGPLQGATFYFRVFDGRFQHVYKTFDINVHPIRLNVTILRPVDIQQGRTSTTIGTECISVDANVRLDLVAYVVTRRPEHGIVHAREKSDEFRHSDLQSKSVLYVQQNMSASNDSLELTARVSQYEVRNLRLAIRVVPLMIASPSLEVVAGERTKLSVQYLDATPLAKLSRQDPSFFVARKPRYAKVMRIMNRTMSSGEKRGLQEKEIGVFSHSQILSGLIYLVCKKVPTADRSGFLDNFEFVLKVPQTAVRFQPARGTFDFRVKLANDYYNNSLDGPMDPVGHEGELTIAPNMSNDYTLLLGMLMGVMLLGFCVIVTLRCSQAKYKDPNGGDEDEMEDDMDDLEQDKVDLPSPAIANLPRPPGHLLPATPNLKRYSNEHRNNSLSSSTPLPPMMPTLTSTLPQCKVIPLSPLDTTLNNSSELDASSGRYPYGMPDVDEWSSSFETTDIPCPSQTSQRAASNPLLRRNQYWV
uniref:Laminin G domain-containing protein n=1 Tax=Trichogramma kaykai TaxID=54128 RepID=A0ABD2VZ75_9HYME